MAITPVALPSAADLIARVCEIDCSRGEVPGPPPICQETLQWLLGSPLRSLKVAEFEIMEKWLSQPL